LDFVIRHFLPMLSWLSDELAALDQAGLRRRLSARDGAQAATIVLDGQSLVNFGSNDYLALAADPRLASAATAAIQADGFGSGASPLITGRSRTHERLEQRLAEFEGTEAALVFPSGFAANLAAVTALAGPGDVVFSDAKNHASLWDGCRLSRADVRAYPHADWQRLDAALARASGCRRRLIVTDSLFSMDGDLAPLVELAEVARRHEAMLLIDEAHATGVFGLGGRGVAEHLGVEESVTARVGTLSKALGCSGGFICGSRLLIDWLTQRARSYIYSTAAPAAISAAALAALEIVIAEPQRGGELLQRAAALRARLAALGWTLGGSMGCVERTGGEMIGSARSRTPEKIHRGSDPVRATHDVPASQIIPIVVGQPQRAVEISQRLRQRGLLVPAIRPPTVPEGEACLRISLTWGHSEEQIAALVEALSTPEGSQPLAPISRFPTPEGSQPLAPGRAPHPG
jgi:8-amino-7-oxononanoate synthase